MTIRILSAITAIYIVLAGLWVLNSGVVRPKQELLNVACDPTRELWQDINGQFLADYEQRTGERWSIRQSHGGSGSQARSVIDGLDADVVTLALYTDTDAIRKSGRIAQDWEKRLPNRSLPFTSTMVIVVRAGNPKQIRDWADLARPGVSVIIPNPKTSGNGKWALLALWGSITQGGGSDEAASEFLAQVFRNVPTLESGARGASLSFTDKKIGDAIITWENEAYLEKEKHPKLEIIYPAISIDAEPHVAMVDTVVKKKGTERVAKAYLEYLYTDAAQRSIAKHYYRPCNTAIRQQYAPQLREIPLFKAQALGADWDSLQQKFFAEGAMFDQIYARGKRS